MKAKIITLPNGLTVVLEENHSAPVLSFNALVKVGSADETDAEAGISHFIEHMLFKGTKNRKVGDIARDVEMAGGEINAYTSYDQTVYYINMSKRFGDKGLEILADAVTGPTFDAGELEREKEVILEEIRREKDNPGRFVGEILFQKAFARHPYRRPIIGFEETVRSFSQENLFDYYRRWYTPKNAAFIVVGDFETDGMLKKIEEQFGQWTTDHGQRTKSAIRITEPPQMKPVVIIEPDNIQSIYFSLGFHIPQITHRDIPALDILSHILAGSDSSRLEQVLKEKKHLVQSIYSYAYSPKDPGLMILGGHLNVTQAQKAFEILMEEIDKLKTEGPTSEEIRRAKLNIRANQVYEKETAGGQAGKLAYFLAAADSLEFEEEYYQKIQTVEAKDVVNAANRYLLQTNMTAAMLAPQADYGKEWTAKTTESLKSPRLKPKAQARHKPAKMETPKLIRLDCGTKLILKESHHLPVVSICTASLGGLLAETSKNNGIYHLAAQCITKGTAAKSALEVTEAIEGMAGHLDGYSGKNSFGLKSEFLSEYVREGLDLFFECLLEPRWDSEEIEKEKKFTLEAIKNQEDSLSTLAFSHFQKALFPTHPYGMRVIGTKTSVKALNRAKLVRHYRETLSAKNMVVSLAGDFTTDAILNLLKTKLNALSKKAHTFKLPRTDPKPRHIEKIITKKQKEQAHVVLGFMGSTIKSPEHYPMIVLNTILSGMGGRLFLELRDKMSLAYSVASVLQEGLDPGYFAVYMGTEPSKVPTALKGIEEELKKITSDLVTTEELEKTQNHLVGTYELDLQKIAALSQSYAFNELYGLGFKEVYRYPEKILAVTREDILKAAKKYIDLKAYVLSIVEP
ncbi:MAG: pitrilysin family protein [bacterium]|nr:pitrilysin family protein [bacterium]